MSLLLKNELNKFTSKHSQTKLSYEKKNSLRHWIKAISYLIPPPVTDYSSHNVASIAAPLDLNEAELF